MYNFVKLPKNERKAIFQITAERMKLPLPLVEKDFWVCFVLNKIFSDNILNQQLFFKGGTSLSKAFKLIKRFSEDVDLVLDSSYITISSTPTVLSKNQQDKFDKGLIEKTEKYIEQTLNARFNELFEKTLKLKIDENNKTHVILQYSSVTEKNNYIRNEIKLEINPIAEKCPNQFCLILPYIAEEIELNIEEVQIPTIIAERTFWEKATILHNESFRPKNKVNGRYSRHYYDLYKLGNSRIKKQAFSKLELLQQVCEFKTKHYCNSWSNYALAANLNFTLVPDAEKLEKLKYDYNEMKEMIYEENIPTWEDIIDYLKNLEDEIGQLIKH